MRGSRKFARGGSILATFFFLVLVCFLFVCFLVDEGWVDPNGTISGRFAGVLMMANH